MFNMMLDYRNTSKEVPLIQIPLTFDNISFISNSELMQILEYLT